MQLSQDKRTNLASINADGDMLAVLRRLADKYERRAEYVASMRYDSSYLRESARKVRKFIGDVADAITSDSVDKDENLLCEG